MESNISYLESLPRDLVRVLFNRLSADDLIHIFQSSKYLRDRYLVEYQDKIGVEMERSRREREQATKEYIRSLEYIQQKVSSMIYEPHRFYTTEKRLCLLSKRSTQLLGLSHMPQINGQAIYTSDLLRTWINIYLKQNNIKFHNAQIQLDDFLNELLGYPVPPIGYGELSNTIDKLIDCNVNIDSTPQLVTAIVRESYELRHLLNLVVLLTKVNTK